MFGNDNNYGSNFFVPLLLGGVIGASLALLFAPQSGKKMRRKIADMADDAKDYASTYAKKFG